LGSQGALLPGQETGCRGTWSHTHWILGGLESDSRQKNRLLFFAASAFHSNC